MGTYLENFSTRNTPKKATPKAGVSSGRGVGSNIYNYAPNAGTILAAPLGLKKSSWREDLAASTARLNRGSSGYGRGGGGGYGSYPAVSMPTLSPIDVPTLTAPDLPEYTAPERDEARVSFLQRKAAAPGISKLRGGVQAGITSTRGIDNPNVRKHTLRGLLSGFGEGLGSVTGAADITGLREYEREYAPVLEQARTRFGTETQQVGMEAALANQGLLMQYQQQLADRNARFGLLSNVFQRQPPRQQASAVNVGEGGMGAGTYRPPGGVLLGPYNRRFIS